MKNIQLLLVTLLTTALSTLSYAQTLSIAKVNSVQSYNSQSTQNNSNAREKLDYALWQDLLQTHVSRSGVVNYGGFKKDVVKLNAFLRQLSTAKITSSWSKNDKIAYWINTYNAYTVKLILNYLPVNSIKEIDNPWKKSFFSINNKTMNLATIEHDILRDFKDPRIHFAINCASASCPKLLREPYKAHNLERLLEQQTTNFINDPFHNTISPYAVRVSKIFDWYKKDFKETHGSVTSFINQYSKSLIVDQKDKGYKEYDWTINSVAY